MTSEHRVCDYEGSPYRRVFWEEADRSYEDAAERLAVRALLPPSGGRLLDIGAGYGRLIAEYSGYRQVILLDYALSMLADARARLGPSYTYVCADLYHLPFATGALDAIVQVRVLHHVACIEDALGEVARCLRPGGDFVLEFANKRHAKARVRHRLGRQREDPESTAPHEFVPLNWDFHPRHVEGVLAGVGLRVRERRAVSLFRQRHVKRVVPAPALAWVDAIVGRRLGGLAPAPSQFVHALSPGDGPAVVSLWQCPECGREPLVEAASGLVCSGCDRVWPVVDGIHVLRPGVSPRHAA